MRIEIVMTVHDVIYVEAPSDEDNELRYLMGPDVLHAVAITVVLVEAEMKRAALKHVLNPLWLVWMST